MIYLENCIPEKEGYIIPIGDLHIGDPAFRDFGFKKISGYIKWIKENPNSRVILGGDIFNCATRESKTSPFGQKDNEFQLAVKLFEPIRSQIVGAVTGNHENRLVDFANFDIMNAFCQKLEIPYMGYSGVINFKVKKEPDGYYRHNYFIYVHHTTGGGGSQGGAINRVEKLSDIVEGCDAYLGFHSHKLVATPVVKYYPSIKNTHHQLEEHRVWYISCGSYLEYNNSYPEMKMMPPQKLGSPKLELSGKKYKSIHVSI